MTSTNGGYLLRTGPLKWRARSLLIGNGGGLYFLAFGALLLIANEVASAWSLIVGIGKDTGAKDIMLGRQPTSEGPPAGQLAAEEDSPARQAWASRDVKDESSFVRRSSSNMARWAGAQPR